MGTVTSPSDRRIHGEGTPEAEWQAWPGLAALPTVEAQALVPMSARAVIVAPHPDDEVLGAGGLIALLAQAHRKVLLIAATDGTASHPGSTVWTPDRLARERPLETERALAALGWASPAIHRLGFEDGTLATHEAALSEAVARHLRGGDVVFTTWRLDGHPDHEACGRACTTAAARMRARLVEMPIWSWHWGRPGDPRWPWARSCRLALPPEVARAKQVATQAFVSQTEPDPGGREHGVLPAWALARLLRPMEVFFR